MIREILAAIVKELEPEHFASAIKFHNALEVRLKAQDLTVKREYPVQDRGDGRKGYIDLVVLEPSRAAIELDNVNPRRKSLMKLKTFDGERLVVLRRTRTIEVLKP